MTDLEEGADGGSAQIVRGSAWLLGGVAVGAASGALFWLFAARAYDESSVGRASAMFTSVLFVNYATSLGLPVAVTAFAGDRSERAGTLYSWAVLLTTASSAVGTLGYLLLVAPDARQVLFRWSEVGGLAVFFVIVTGASLAVLNDVRLMAARRWGWVLARFAVVGLVRLPLLGANPGMADDTWLFVLSAGVLSASGYAMLPLLPRLTGLRASLGRLPVGWEGAVRYSGVNYAGMLASQAPSFLLPVLVLVNVPAAENARFFVAWSIVSVAFLLPQTVHNVLLVEGRRSQEDLGAHARTSLAVAAATMAACLAGVLVLGRPVLGLYGEHYAEAFGTLVILMLAGLPWAITSTGLGWVRVRHDSAGTIAITAALAVSVCVPAVLAVPGGGTRAAPWCWLAGHLAAAALTVAVAARAVRALRPGSSTLPDRPAEAVPVGLRPREDRPS